jgi:hypothetical protein
MCHISVMLFLAPQIAVGAQWARSAVADRDHAVMSRFLTAIDAYVVEHHRVFDPLSEGMMCLPDDTLGEMNAVAQAPREARRPPREGEVFTPDVVELFKRLLSTTFAGEEAITGDLIARLDKEALCAPALRVNEPPPRNLAHAMTPLVVSALPQLPEELEYRFVGRDLVLVDVSSNLVVDVIRAALSFY